MIMLHNRLSFKLYETVKTEFPGMKIVTVFGCPGSKAYVRRRDLGCWRDSIPTRSS